jgi:hypothetical protein
MMVTVRLYWTVFWLQFGLYLGWKLLIARGGAPQSIAVDCSRTSGACYCIQHEFRVSRCVAVVRLQCYCILKPLIAYARALGCFGVLDYSKYSHYSARGKYWPDIHCCQCTSSQNVPHVRALIGPNCNPVRDSEGFWRGWRGRLRLRFPGRPEQILGTLKQNAFARPGISGRAPLCDLRMTTFRLRSTRRVLTSQVSRARPVQRREVCRALEGRS